jgi:ABC-type multidrug transport system fused ATPase/permease subunit
MNRWTVLLLLVLARLLISLDGLNTNLVTAKTRAVSACTKVEDVGSSMASMPHYLSAGLNRMAADGITKAVQGLVEILLMILTGVQQLIMFFIEIEVGLLLCFSTAIARAVLEVGEFAIKGATEALETAIKNITSDLNSAASKITSALDTVRDTLNSIPMPYKPRVPDTSGLEENLKRLDNVHIDTGSLLKDLEDLEQRIDYDNVKNVAREAIAVPFDMVKRLLNESYGTWEFDESVFPVPEKESLSLCPNSTLEDFFEVLFRIAANARTISIAVLIFLAVVAGGVMACWESTRFERQRHKSETLVNRVPMDTIYVASRPLTAGTGLWISEKVSGNRRRQFLIRWVIAYATTYTALFVLALSVAGAFSCLCQWIIMQAIQKEIPDLAATVGDLAGQVVTSVEQASTRWANDSNNVILEFQGDINDNMFGHVRNATHATNDTINKLDDAMHEGVSKAFGGVPPLEQFLNDVLGCLIGNKLESVQEGLTWVNDKARVTFPLFPVDVFSVSANDPTSGGSNSTDFLSTPSSSVTDEITDAVDSVVGMLWSSIVQEVVISLVLFLIYLAYVFFAMAQAAIRMAMGERYVPPHRGKTPC